MAIAEREPRVSDLEFASGKLAFSSFHFENGLTPDCLGDRVIRLGPNTIVLFDVSLGDHTTSRVTGEDVAITESSVADFLRGYLEKNFSDELSAGEVVELCARFLEEKKIIGPEKITDLALSVAVCQKTDSELIFASFGSIRVFGPNGKELISSQKPYDPLAPERPKRPRGIKNLFRRRARRVTRECEIQEVRIPRGQPVLMATNGLDPRALDFPRFAREGFPLGELTPDCFVEEGLVVRIN